MGDLFLSDDVVSDDRPPRRSRPRWVDGLGLGVLVLGIVAIGVLGDRGAPDRSPAPTTTTSTTSPSRRGRPAVSTSTTEAPSTTTTQFQQLAGRLPFTTGAVVVVVAPSSTTLIDVDAGRAQRVGSSAYGVVAVEGGFVLPLEDTLRFLPSSGGAVVAHGLPPGTGGVQVLPGGPGRVWVSAGLQPADVLTEVTLSGGLTGKRVEVPVGTYAATALDDGVVVSARGTLVLVDGKGGKRSLGTGEVLAAGGHTLVRASCHLLVCGTDVVDVRSGRSHPVDLPDSYDRQATLSLDGRSVAVSHADPTGIQQLTFTDLRTGRSWTAEGIDARTNVAFAPDGKTVFATSTGALCAFPIATGERHCLDLGDRFGEVHGIAAVSRP